MMITKDEIIDLARQAGLTKFVQNYDQSWAIEQFYKMAVEREREACALIVEQGRPTRSMYLLEHRVSFNVLNRAAKEIRARNTQECCGNPFKCEGNCVEHCVDKVQP